MFSFTVRHIDGAMEIGSASTEFKLLKAECLIYLERYDVRWEIFLKKIFFYLYNFCYFRKRMT